MYQVSASYTIIGVQRDNLSSAVLSLTNGSRPMFSSFEFKGTGFYQGDDGFVLILPDLLPTPDNERVVWAIHWPPASTFSIHVFPVKFQQSIFAQLLAGHPSGVPIRTGTW